MRPNSSCRQPARVHTISACRFPCGKPERIALPGGHRFGGKRVFQPPSSQ
jgi:hypothetical protein